MSDTAKSLSFLTDNLQNRELYPKITELLDYATSIAEADFADVAMKVTDPANPSVNPEVVPLVISERGFDYVVAIAQALLGADQTTLVRFVSLLGLLKGHRKGLEVTLRAIGMEAVIREWWEQAPKGEVFTYDLDVFVELSQVANIFDVIKQIRIFSAKYVYPQLKTVNVNFDIPLVESTTAVGGFVDQELLGDIVGTL